MSYVELAIWIRLLQVSSKTAVNFLAEEGDARVREAYPGETWDRLVAIKRRYDPTNLFHLNQNVPPGPPPTEGGRLFRRPTTRP